MVGSINMNTSAIRASLEAMKIKKYFKSVELNTNNNEITVFDLQDNEEYPCVFVWNVGESRAYSEDQVNPRGDDLDKCESATVFMEWINSFYDE